MGSSQISEANCLDYSCKKKKKKATASLVLVDFLPRWAPQIATMVLEQREDGLCETLPVTVPDAGLSHPRGQRSPRGMQRAPRHWFITRARHRASSELVKKYIMMFLFHEAALGCRTNLSPGCCECQQWAVRKYSSGPRDNDTAQGSLGAFQGLL